MNLLEQLQNHSHRNSFLALRPADATETTVAWKLAFENTNSPSGLILSRQNVPDVPAASGDRYAEALAAEKGAYAVREVAGRPDIILVGNGSEVSTLVEGAAILEKEDLKIKIVSAPSEGLFRNQPSDYQQSLLPTEVPTFGLTAGLPSALRGLVPYGKIWGLNHFGHSAPYTVLDEKFGFTGKNVAEQVQAYLKEVNA